MHPTTISQRFSIVAFSLLLLASTHAVAQAGALDPSFANNGIFTSTLDFNASAVALQSNGQIVLAGNGGVNGEPADSLIRLNTNGTLDQTFGSGGVVNVTNPGGSVLYVLCARHPTQRRNYRGGRRHAGLRQQYRAGGAI
jgi:hypothetical protein